ncbi:1145_t:CDS:1, partial [Cetraspora pellucida]
TDVNINNETIQSIEQSTNSELLILINKFPLGIEENRIELDKYINLDNYIAANEMPSMKSIIETVEEKESSEPNLSLIQHIFYKSVLEYIESLFLYIGPKSSDNLNFNITFLQDLDKFKKKL